MKHLKELREKIKKQITELNKSIDSNHDDLEMYSDDGIDVMHTDDNVITTIFKRINRSTIKVSVLSETLQLINQAISKTAKELNEGK